MNPENLSNSTETQTIWYIQVLSFFGSAIAGMFFLFFLGILDFFDSSVAVTILGIIFIASVTFLSYSWDEATVQTKNPILLSFFLQGYILLLVGFDGLVQPSYRVFLITNICLQIALYFIFQNSIYRILSIIIAFVSLMALLDDTNILFLYPYIGASLGYALIYFSNEDHLPNKDPYLFYTITLCFLGLYILPHIFSTEMDVSLITSFVFLVITVLYLCYEYFKGLSKLKLGLLFLLILVLFLPLIKAPGVLASHIILFIGLRKSSLFLSNLARLSMIGYFFILYYQMDITLLDKSLFMLGSGFLFLLAYLIWDFYERKIITK